MKLSFPTTNYKYIPAGIMLMVLNLFDSVGTIIHIHSNAMYEYSPIMAPVLSFNEYAFIVVKHLMVVAGILLILRSRPNLIKAAFGITIPVYTALAVWHVVLFTYYGV